MFYSDLGSVCAYGALALAIVSFWVKRTPSVWLTLLSFASLFGWFAGRVNSMGLLMEGLLGFTCFLFFRQRLPMWARILFGFLISLTSAAFMMHKIPGFNNWRVLKDISVSSGALPIQLYLNFDKPLVGLFLMGWASGAAPSRAEWIRIFKTILPCLGFTATVLLGFSWFLGYVRLDFKWYSFSPLWLGVNLLFACVAEEAFFRGFVQKQLSRIFKKPVSLFLSSCLFGLVHLQGGWTYVFLAAIAGLFYGYAYLKTNRLEASIGVHFFLNAIHFLAFTYPALR